MKSSEVPKVPAAGEESKSSVQTEKLTRLDLSKLTERTQRVVHAELAELKNQVGADFEQDGLSLEQAKKHLSSLFANDTTLNIGRADIAYCMQVLLQEKGCYKLDLDGRYAGGTKTAVRKLQEKLGMSKPHDGVFGRLTLAKCLGKKAGVFKAKVSRSLARSLRGIEARERRAGLPALEGQEKVTTEEAQKNWQACYKWYGERISSLVKLLPDNALKTKLETVLSQNTSSSKQAYKEAAKLVPEIRAMIKSSPVKSEVVALKRLDLLLSTKMPDQIMEAPLDEQKGKVSRRYLRDVAIINGFQLDRVAQGVSQVQKVFAPAKALQGRSSLTSDQQNTLKGVCEQMQNDGLIKHIIQNGPMYIGRINYLLPSMGPEAQKSLQGLKGMIQNLINLSADFAYIQRKGKEGDENFWLKALPVVTGVVVSVAAVAAAPVTGGLSLAAASTFVAGTAAGYAASQVASAATDQYGEQQFGLLYTKQSRISQLLQDDKDVDLVMKEIGEDLVYELGADILSLGAARVLKGSFSKFLKSLKGKPKLKIQFQKLLKRESRRFNTANRAITKREGQKIIRFLKSVAAGVSEDVLQNQAAKLYGMVLAAFKPDVMEGVLGVPMLRTGISSDGSNHLRVSYKADSKEEEKILRKLGQNFNEPFHVKKIEGKIKVTGKQNGHTFELNIVLEKANVALLRDLRALNQPFSRAVYNAPSAQGPKLQVAYGEQVSHLQMIENLRTKGYKVDLQKGDGLSYHVTKGTPFVNQTLEFTGANPEQVAYIRKEGERDTAAQKAQEHREKRADDSSFHKINFGNAKIRKNLNILIKDMSSVQLQQKIQSDLFSNYMWTSDVSTNYMRCFIQYLILPNIAQHKASGDMILHRMLSKHKRTKIDGSSMSRYFIKNYHNYFKGVIGPKTANFLLKGKTFRFDNLEDGITQYDKNDRAIFAACLQNTTLSDAQLVKLFKRDFFSRWLTGDYSGGLLKLVPGKLSKLRQVIRDKAR